jgi:hypothetical protein
MRAALMIAAIVLSCSGCAGPAPALHGNDTQANTSANYDFKGDLTEHGGSTCWWYCP